eukprot:Platyproteum_vivax@DN2364_c0_g1_i1.p2
MAHKDIITVASKDEWEQAKTNNNLMVADFFAAWCGPCRQIAPYIEELAKENKGTIVFVSVNVDEMPEVAEAEGISAMPTFKFFAKGALVDESTGANRDMIAAKVKNLLAQA